MIRGQLIASIQAFIIFALVLRAGACTEPPHDASGHTWHHPDAVLLDIIKRESGPP